MSYFRYCIDPRAGGGGHSNRIVHFRDRLPLSLSLSHLFVSFLLIGNHVHSLVETKRGIY
jgi:hypothetical protein